MLPKGRGKLISINRILEGEFFDGYLHGFGKEYNKIE